jgi:glycosyltransferase involved in cell wall biosynthesis
MLSICIPTYNRASRLQHCLQSIEAAAIGIDHEFEVVVSNNASTDNTSKILSGWKFTNPNACLKLITNDSNLGAYLNITRIIEEAKGTKLFWLTDDDLILPWGLQYIFDEMEKSDFEYTKFALISYLEQSKVSYVYGGDKDINTLNLDMNNLLKIYEVSHVLTGSLVSKNICRRILDDSEPNIYPSSVWAISSAGSAQYISTPVAIHIGENEVYWEMDLDISTVKRKNLRLNSDFQLALTYSPIPLASFKNSKVLPKYILRNYGKIEGTLLSEFDNLTSIDKIIPLFRRYLAIFRKSLALFTKTFLTKI